MNIDTTLEKFLLSRIGGEVIPDENPNKRNLVIPGTIGAMVPKLAHELSECVRIKLLNFIPLEHILELLIEYYTAIDWQPCLGMSTAGDCIGDVQPKEALGEILPLALWAGYQANPINRSEKIPHLIVAISPTLC
jgi:hypothetical protein